MRQHTIDFEQKPAGKLWMRLLSHAVEEETTMFIGYSRSSSWRIGGLQKSLLTQEITTGHEQRQENVKAVTSLDSKVFGNIFSSILKASQSFMLSDARGPANDTNLA